MWEQTDIFGPSRGGPRRSLPWVASIVVRYVTSHGDLRALTAAVAGAAARRAVYDDLRKFVTLLVTRRYRRPTEEELRVLDRQLRLRGF